MMKPVDCHPLFDEAVMRRWAQRATHDPLVVEHRTMANLRVGLQTTSGDGSKAWLHIDEAGVTAGLGDIRTHFDFVGENAAFDDLAQGFPFNRLVRQHRLDIQGDIRACVQNWLLLYAVMRSSAHLGV